jgi:protein arginine kinase activator
MEEYERHFECSGCKKPVSHVYTEIIGKMTYRIGMCSDCPVLRKKLYGNAATVIEGVKDAELVCGNCGTTIDEIKMGAPLGCAGCYEVFQETIVTELTTTDRLAQTVLGVNRSEPLHLGRLPKEDIEVNPALKLLSLHQALHETLSREDYEQAAWLRDQIKALTQEKEHDKSNA